MRFICNCLLPVLAMVSFFVPAWGAERDAVAISANLRARHLPFGGVLDPIFASSTSDQIIGYSRCGDSALWTGALLAAEAFHYKVTQAPEALANVKSALAALKGLADVTGDNRLARCMVMANSPFAAGIADEEERNTIHQNPPWIWVDNTSRDQIVGTFFGLGIAFDLVDDPSVKAAVAELSTRLIGFISRHQWSPNDDPTNAFTFRPEELQTLLQIARHVDPSNDVSGPFFVLPVITAVLGDVLSNSSYFKFNLSYMSFYHLVRLQNNGSNRGAYATVRNHTEAHQNAFFDVVDRALNGPDAVRDLRMRTLLEQLLLKPRRDFYVDVSKTVKVCGVEACEPIPVPLRTPTDFLWQRNPFQLFGGGTGLIESAGIDYLLPYWMGRYYGTIPAEVQSAAAPSDAIAPNSLAAFYGKNLAAGTAQASTQPLPATLGGVTLTVTDSRGTARIAPLVFVSTGQINFLVPDGTVAGPASFSAAHDGVNATVTAAISPVSPRLFSTNGAGNGVAAATAIATPVANPGLQSPVAVFQCMQSTCVTVPIRLGSDTSTYLTLYGTGIRNRTSLTNVSVTTRGVSVPVQYAGPTPGFSGLDQVNVLLTSATRGAGDADVVLTVDGQASNAVTVQVQ